MLRKLAPVALVLIAACASPPAPDPWKADAYTVEPSRETPDARGFLVVETAFVTVDAGHRLGELADRRYARCRIHDGRGRFVREVEGYADEGPPRIPLAPGNYIVTTKVGLEWRSVQVVVSGDRTSRVRLADFRPGSRLEGRDDGED
jgi:hypothetical protein